MNIFELGKARSNGVSINGNSSDDGGGDDDIGIAAKQQKKGKKRTKSEHFI